MKYRVLASVGCAAAIAFAQPVAYLAQTVSQRSGRAADILTAAGKAIAGGKLDALRTLTVQADVRRNAGSMQIGADTTIFVELPDKYAQVITTNAGPGMVVAGGGRTGFNGDHPLHRASTGGMPKGAMVVRTTYRAAQPRVFNRTIGTGSGHTVSQAELTKQLQEMQQQEPVMADYSMYFEDWRDAGGGKFPFRMRRAMGGTTTEEWSISKVRINPKIDPKTFAVDDGR